MDDLTEKELEEIASMPTPFCDKCGEQILFLGQYGMTYCGCGESAVDFSRWGFHRFVGSEVFVGQADE